MADLPTLARNLFSSKWLLVLVTAASSAAAAVVTTLAVTATHQGDGSASTVPGRWAAGQDRADADRAICAGHAQAAALMRSAAQVATTDEQDRNVAQGKYDQAAVTMYRATTIDAHFDLSSAAETFTAALRTLVMTPGMPEVRAAAAAADETVTAMCARRVPDASGEPSQ